VIITAHFGNNKMNQAGETVSRVLVGTTAASEAVSASPKPKPPNKNITSRPAAAALFELQLAA
jgi:hypothetical protein